MSDAYAIARRRMVESQLAAGGVRDPEVLRAMGRVPRHLFVDGALRDRAYGDHALPIGHGQTISQPFMVAVMTQALALSGGETVLEIGTGSGYQTAVLAQIADRVFSVERLAPLYRRARVLLDRLGCHRVVLRHGDGTLGWPEHAPYDAIIVTAGAPHVPAALRAQLVPGGRLVIPVGDRRLQRLLRLTRDAAGDRIEELNGCVFVDLVGADGWPAESAADAGG
ncbi:MAG TPA: protein-L-isoaspartate(D-aspartate) O-methyltransferase [Candidatus Methanoperedens sp.]|nr:protein-L-isoaspartate(D-aspartate) O-methyltransferase [Candidatus Methanoperedens sp.]